MKRFCFRVLAVVGLSCTAMFAAPVSNPCSEVVSSFTATVILNTAPTVCIQVNGRTLPVEATFLGKESPTAPEYFLSASDASADFALNFLGLTNSDPFVSYGIAVSNLSSSTLSFSFFISSPFVGGPYDTLKSSHSGSVTDSDGRTAANGNVVIGTNLFSNVHQPFVNADTVDGVNTGCNISGGPGFSADCITGVNPPSEFPIVTGDIGDFGVVVSFDLSPGDIYTLNGRVELANSAIPEPLTFALVGTALTGLGLLRRRRS